MGGFADLDFKPHPNWDGIQALAFFPNGYGVSVIKSDHSYGGPSGLYELAVLEGDADKSSLTYDTPVTSDVEGHLTPEMVSDLMAQVQALPPALSPQSEDLKS